MTEEQWKNKVPKTIMLYRQMEMSVAGRGIIREVIWQYRDMATGGTGGTLGFKENGHTTCRGVNYPGYPDEFFQEVCDLMSWPR